MELFERIFKLSFLNEATDFVRSLDKKVKRKIFENMGRIQKGEKNVELFKKLEGTDIWEFRTLYNKKAYRLLAFWDKDTETMVVVTHGFIKKTDKTPKKEIVKAENIRKDYFEQKKAVGLWKK